MVDLYADRLSVEQQVEKLTLVAREATRVLNPGGTVIVMGEAEVLSAWCLAAGRAGLVFVSEIVVLWDTSHISHGATNRQRPALNLNIHRYVKSGYLQSPHIKSALIPSNVIVCRQVLEEHRLSPMQRPVELMNFLLTTFTRVDDLVVDPMCGSGTTLVAAQLTNRRWIGGDVDQHQCVRSKYRVNTAEAEELAPMWMFVDGGLVPVGDHWTNVDSYNDEALDINDVGVDLSYV